MTMTFVRRTRSLDNGSYAKHWRRGRSERQRLGWRVRRALDCFKVLGFRVLAL